jgi:hypothetical protein
MTKAACRAWSGCATSFRGSSPLSSVLIASDKGHILLDGGPPQSASLIDASVRKLGFRTEDIRLGVPGRCLILVAHVTQAAQFVPIKPREDAGLALARFVPIHAAMFNKGTTWPPRVPTRARAFSGSQTPTPTDRLDGSRAPADSATVAQGESRPTESHWESVIDRATD